MMRTLPALLALLALPHALHAQGGGAVDAREVARRAIERRAEARSASGSLAAGIHTVSVIDVNSDSSMAALVPTGTVLHESVGSLYRDAVSGTRIRIQAQRGSAGAEGIARSLVENFRSLGDYIGFDGDRVVLLNTSIVAPLMLRNVLPSLSSTVISLFKDTSLAAAIAVPELTFEARKINVESFRVVETWMITSALYVATCFLIAALLRLVERRLALPR